MFGKRKKKTETPEPIVEPIVEPVAEAKPKLTARIISMEILSSGLIETLFVSNSKMGELGEEFDI